MLTIETKELEISKELKRKVEMICKFACVKPTITDKEVKIDKEMNINIAFDTNAKFPEKIMYLVKSLKNSIAHNDVVFDVRFKDGKIDTKLCKYLENETGCTGIDFNTITDYILIIDVLLKKYEITKNEINKFINDIKNT